MFRRLFHKCSLSYSIDLGTANTLVNVVGKGILVNQPSFVATYERGPNRGKIAAFGAQAKELYGRSPETITCSTPLKAGVIHDFDGVTALLGHFMKSIPKRLTPFKGKVMVGVPAGASKLEKRAVIEATEQVGAGEVFLVEEAVAAAIGAGLPVTEAKGSMIVDIGGGTTDVAVVSFTGVVTSQSIPTAGNRMDEKIIEYVRKAYCVSIGDQTAERIKMHIGAARPTPENPELTIQGWDTLNGKPRKITLSQEEVAKAMREPIYEIIGIVRSQLERTPPEIAADVINRGIFLVGGGSLLRGLDTLISEEIGVPTSLVENPLTVGVRGSGIILEQWEKYQDLVLDMSK